MVDISCEEPPDPSPEESPGERAPRTNLMLTATIEAAGLKSPVRIRNLSESGALLEGGVFPNVDEKLILRRLQLEISGTVVWRSQSRCGVKFDGTAFVGEWVAGKQGGAGRDQLRVDRIQAAVRAGPLSTPKPASRPAEINDGLDGRIAEELAHVRRLIENIGNELTDTPIIVQRYPAALQSFDVACQILDNLAVVLAAENRGAAVDAIGMKDLRARLLRKTLF